ncbi:regulatory ArsR family protein [Modicisalibacter xianhensis]|uniref:Regulatory ArsR family protein n=1 Tax=Modicisalibacter xianhensis TaxID=442341 RepID=A0A4R8FH64_9GAMM|nr:ArsR family transcriptional regulator [Halomonas xianhensis]TDX22217.1 regulatory ArsR family protein [Halomonas xianhensis]
MSKLSSERELPKTIRRKFLVLSTLARMGEATTSELVKATGISPTSLRRQLAALHTDYQVTVKLTRPLARQKGEEATYVLADWGIIDKRAFLKRFANMKPDDSVLDVRQQRVNRDNVT